MLHTVDTFVLRTVIHKCPLDILHSGDQEHISHKQCQLHKGFHYGCLLYTSLAMQKFTTKEPAADMAEVAIKAVEAVFDWRAYLKEEFDLDIPYETEETENADS